MKRSILLIISFFLYLSPIIGQQNETSFYATMSLVDAEELIKEHPSDIIIIAKKRNEAAVHLTNGISHKLHQKVLAHGPGYIFQPSSEAAIKALNHSDKKSASSKMAFTITEDATVALALDVIKVQNIENHIKELENYGTRYHTSASAKQSAEDLKLKWEAMASTYNRTDVSVRLVNHVNTPMPSVVMTIQGSETPEEYVIVGGHLDSTSNQGNNNAPGADDDASGIATITEATRALFEIGFKPRKTIEVMGYAAEEVGLVGSTEIAQEYKRNNVNVVAVGQFDMTNYNGSPLDIYFIEDNTDAGLNSFFKSLIDHYNTSGNHQFTYGTALCNYGCSDHASWHREGYPASFPFEASFSSSNSNIHTSNDTFSISGTAEHAAKFAKLCTEFIIEVAKNDATLSVQDFEQEGYNVYVQNKTLYFETIDTGSEIDHISIYDVTGKNVLQKNNLGVKGSFSMSFISSGIYVLTLTNKERKQLSKKIVLQ